ncbi:MAG: cold shock domain-containing protein [Elusimicrobiota bacterium]
MNEELKQLFSKHKYFACIKQIESSPGTEQAQDVAKVFLSSLLGTGQHERAIEFCKRKIEEAKSRKDRNDWQYRLAGAYLETKPELALEAIQTHLREFKQSIHGRAVAIRICSKLARHSAAEQYYREGIDIIQALPEAKKKSFGSLIAMLHKDYGDFLHKVAESNQDHEKKQAACEAFQHAANAHPGNHLNWYHLGKVHFELHNLDEAKAAFAHALKIKEEPYIIHQLAQVEAARGHDEEAVKIYSQIPDKRRQPYVWSKLGQCLERLGKQREAGRAYREAIARESNKHYHHLYLGRLFMAMNAKTQAIREFEETRKLHKSEFGPDHSAARELIEKCKQMEEDTTVTFREAAKVKKERGVIARYNMDKGFGFIDFGSKSLFFHITDIKDQSRKGTPSSGQRVLFLVKETPKGFAASEVERASAD